MQSYSQGNEQQIILDLLANHPAGRVLDIGAYDGMTFSNSRALMERGWGGILVEPEPVAFMKLMDLYRDREDVHLIHAAVGTGWYLSRFWRTEDLVSTTSEHHHSKWRDHARYTGMYYTPVMPIERLLIYPVPEFVNIDVEGSSAELALHALRHERGGDPIVWCIEHDGRLRDLLVAGAEHGYQMVLSNAENVVLSR